MLCTSSVREVPALRWSGLSRCRVDERTRGRRRSGRHEYRKLRAIHRATIERSSHVSTTRRSASPAPLRQSTLADESHELCTDMDTQGWFEDRDRNYARDPEAG